MQLHIHMFCIYFEGKTNKVCIQKLYRISEELHIAPSITRRCGTHTLQKGKCRLEEVSQKLILILSSLRCLLHAATELSSRQLDMSLYFCERKRAMILNVKLARAELGHKAVRLVQFTWVFKYY